VIVGGRFTHAGGLGAAGIARWNGKTWGPLGSGVNTGDRDGEVLACARCGRPRLRGRTFHGRRRCAGALDRDVARRPLVGARAAATAPGTDGTGSGGGVSGGSEKVGALGYTNGVLYVGGDFTRAGAVDADRAARWDGTAWSSLGVRTREPVERIAVAPAGGAAARRSRGGRLLPPGRSTTRGVIRFDGTRWSGLGPGLGGGPFLSPIQALTMDAAGRVYACGGPFVLGATSSPGEAPRRTRATAP
jgi:hypothetical protein